MNRRGLVGSLVAALALMTTSCGGADLAGVEPPDPARALQVVTYDAVSIEVVNAITTWARRLPG